MNIMKLIRKARANELSVLKLIRKSRWIAVLSLFSFGMAQANPTGGVVASGSASISNTPSITTINQTSKTAIINWSSFSIGSGQTTSFLATQANSAVLNRVAATGGRSVIDGTLSGNETVYLINGNGILIGGGGVVNTNGFIASTRDISDTDFTSGKYHFVGSSNAGVKNNGSITALDGDVILIGKTVNNKGTISATNGTAGLVAADDVLLNQAGTQHIFVNPTPTATSDSKKTGVNNSGTINAAAAELRAVNGNVYALAINNSGTIRATDTKQQGGDIYLTADDGTVQNTGKLDASATAAKGTGGDVQLKTGKNTGDLVVQSGSIVSHGGQGGTGGNVDVSGAGIKLNAQVDLTTPGGKTGNLLIDPATLTVVDTGGNLGSGDISGGQNPSDPGANDTIDASVVDALLSTTNLTLNADNNITINAAISWTSARTLTLSTNDAGSTININAAISGLSSTHGSFAGLTIDTAGQTDLITDTANLAVDNFVLQSGKWDQIVGDGQSGLTTALPTFAAANDFELWTGTTVNGGWTPSASGAGGASFERFVGGDGTSANPYQITDIYGLQGLASPSDVFLGSAAPYFVLNNNIDASVTANWRSGNGFLPIGSSVQNGATDFEGNLNGQNFIINNLTEAYNPTTAPTQTLGATYYGDVGLFDTFGGNYGGGAFAGVNNLGMTNINYSTVGNSQGEGGLGSSGGGLVALTWPGDTGARFSNDYVTGNITGNGTYIVFLGGMVGLLQGGVFSDSAAGVNINLTTDGPYAYVGGFAADAGTLSLTDGGIQGCYATGNVSVTYNGTSTSDLQVVIGGFVGYTDDLSNDYATGNVTVNGSGAGAGNDVGGFAGAVGSNGTYSNLYSVGTVSDSGRGASVGSFAGIFNDNNNATTFSGVYVRSDNNPGLPTIASYGSGSGSEFPVEIDETTRTGPYGPGTISFATTSPWTEATSATGPTTGFPTLTTAPVLPPLGGGTTPPGSDATSITITGFADGTAITNGEATYGQTITLDGVVVDTANSGTIVNGGTVTFDSPNGAQYTGTINIGANGVATLTLPTLAVLTGGGDYSWTADYSGVSGSFDASSTASALHLVINPAVLTYTADAATQTYGTNNNSFTGTITGLVADDTLSSVTSGTPTFTGANSQFSDVGNYAVTGSGVTTTSANYTISDANQATGNATALTITPASVTVTLTGVVEKTYDSTTAATLGAGNYQVNGILNGDDVSLNDPTAGTYGTANAGTGIAITANGLALTGSKANDYVIGTVATPVTSVSGNVGQIDQATLTLTASDQTVSKNGTINTTPTEGQTYTDNGLQGSDTLSGVLATGPTISSTQDTSVPNTYNGAVDINGSLNNTVGSGANYKIVLVNGNLTVTPSADSTTITITGPVASGGHMTYGQSITLNGSVLDSLNPGTIVNGGTVQFIENGVDYQGTINVDANGVATLTIPTLAVINGGGYDWTANYGGVSGVFAASSTTSAYHLIIDPAVLTYTANQATRTYGASDQTFAGTVTGFVAGDTQATATTGALTFTGGDSANSNVGTYSINGGGLTAQNYTFQQAAGNATALTVSPAVLTYVADAASRTYGANDPTLTGNVTGFVLGQTQATATTGVLAFAGSDTANSNVGSYAINGSGLTANNGNYTFQQAAGNSTALTVNPAVLTYTADAATRTYGASDPNLTGNVTGFVLGQTQATATTGVLAFAGSDTANSNVGTYAINGSGLTANNGNYTFQQATGNTTALTVSPAVLTYVANSASRTYGANDSDLGGTVTGFVLGQNQANATTGSLAFTGSDSATSNVGTYAVNGSGLTANNGNYTFQQAAGNPTALTVNPAMLTLTAADQTVNVGGVVNTTATEGTTYLVSGLQNSQQVGDVLATGPSLSSTQDTSVAGNYPGSIVIAGTLNNGLGSNYTLDLVNGAITVQNNVAPVPNTLSFRQQQELAQTTSIKANANYNALFAQSQFPLTGDADDYVYVATASGEPLHRYSKEHPSETEGTENFAGMNVLAHGSSFTVAGH